ncbi:hypothetical protein IAT38_000472 [Cryptococcus sp. DSM 104549]
MFANLAFLAMATGSALLASSAPLKNEPRAGSYVNGVVVELENPLTECAIVLVDWSNGYIPVKPYTFSIGRTYPGPDRSIDWFFTKTNLWTPNDDWKVTEAAGTELWFKVVDANNVTAYLPNQMVGASTNNHFVQGGECVYVYAHDTESAIAAETAEETLASGGFETALPTDTWVEATPTESSEAAVATPTEAVDVCAKKA